MRNRYKLFVRRFLYNRASFPFLKTKREKTKMRLVRNFEHISGMLRQQSMLTKNDGNHERNKKVNV